MSHEEKLLRLSLIGTILSFYDVSELTKTLSRLRRHVKKGQTKLAKVIGQSKAIDLISSLDPHWKKLFDEHKDKKFSASALIIAIWRPELQPYISHTLLDKYSASEIVESADIELFTYYIADEFDRIIKEVLDERISGS